MNRHRAQSFTVQCPECGVLLEAYPQLGESIRRAKDAKLLEHNCRGTGLWPSR